MIIKKCDLCEQTIKEYRNNPAPLLGDACNQDYVLPMFDKPTDAKVGDLIEIVEMLGAPQYVGKQGIVERIDSIGQLHGTWGGLAVDRLDIIKIIARAGSDALEPDREPKRTPRPRGAKPKNKEEN